MTENGLEIEKIIVSPEDELIDILKEIENTKANRIILTFAESSDLLISPINLKVIQECADELKKPLITLIIQNPTGVRNAKEAGMTVTNTSGSIIDTFWEQSEQGMEDRIKEKKENLKRIRSVPVNNKNEEVVETVEEAYDPELIAQEIQKRRDSGQKSEFQKQVEEAIDKSKKDIDSKSKKIIENGVELSIDEDINSSSPSLLGKNLKNPPSNNIFEEKKDNNKNSMIKLPKISFPMSFKGIFLKIILPLLGVLAISGYLYLTSAPLVKVKIYVESKGVSIDRTFSGDLKTAEFNLKDGKVPVKKEEINNSASNSTNATGTGYKGSKAEGVVTLKFWGYALNGGQSTNVKAGTQITSGGGLKFEITADTTVGDGGDIIVDAPVRALAVGEEYNLAAGQIFTVDGYTSTDGPKQMEAGNASAFEGGSKTPYKMLSKADVDKVVDGLKKNLEKEAQSSLQEKIDGTWDIVTKSIASKVDGDPETDVPIGAEADTVNVTVKIKTTALFYQKNAIDQSIVEMLTQAAKDKGLFETKGNDQFKVEDNLTKEITIADVKKDTIKVQVKASSNIQPSVDKTSLTNQLKGKSWSEGLAIVQSLKLTDKENTVEFTPTFFPDWLKRFPTKQGRLFIDIVQNTNE